MKGETLVLLLYVDQWGLVFLDGQFYRAPDGWPWLRDLWKAIRAVDSYGAL